MSTPHKTLVFHIGDRKTGSTAIQDAFAQKRVTPKGQKIAYPAKMAHNYLKEHYRAFQTPQKTKAYNQAIEAFETLAKKIRKSSADVCLISAEMFEGVDPALFQTVYDQFFADCADDIRIVAYIRPHGARVLSSFSEHLKNGNVLAIDGTLDSFFAHNNKNRRFHCCTRFSAWRDLFGDRFILRPMIRDQLHQGDVVADFTRYGLNQQAFDIAKGAPSNSSLCLEDLMRLKVFQIALREHPHKLSHAFGWEAARVLDTLPALKTRTKLRLHRALAEEIHRSYLEDARAIDQVFFDGKPLLETELDQAKAKAIDAAQSVDPADWLDPGELRSLGLTSILIARMTADSPQLWTRFWRKNHIKTLKAGAAPTSDS